MINIHGLYILSLIIIYLTYFQFLLILFHSLPTFLKKIELHVNFAFWGDVCIYLKIFKQGKFILLGGHWNY